jgi:lipopolysaccharide export system protein LptA
VVRVSSARLDYSGASREAVFLGGVRAESGTARVQGARGVVFLSPAAGKGEPGRQAKAASAAAGPAGGAVEKIVVSGGVRLEQPGRTGSGEQLLYTASSGSGGNGEFVLTGAPGRPPHVVDERQGSITGATLLFGAGDTGDSTIVVAGEPASHGQARSRVHTETAVRQ